MIRPAVPVDEVQRLAALHAMNALFTPAEERFDRLTRLASCALDMPYAMVSLVDRDALWFKSAHGLPITECNREISFCGHAVLADATFVVEDASTDLRFLDNPLVAGDPNLRAYAGCPLHAEDGSRVGTLCVLGDKPRSFSVTHLQVLRDLAAVVETELQNNRLSATQLELIRERDEFKRRALIDGLTRLWNREAILELLRLQVSRAERGAKLTVAMIDADHFKKVNDLHGHSAGDAVLVELAARIRQSVRPSDAVGRYGGEEFIVLLGDCDLARGNAIAERMRLNISRSPITVPSAELILTVSVGLAEYSNGANALETIVASADAALYQAKHAGRNCVAS